MNRRDAIPVIDLFAGPGGLGEGFDAAGRPAGRPRFDIHLSIEKDPAAHRTLELRAVFPRPSSIERKPALEDNVPMPRPDGWTREQQLIALRLYMRLPFGRLHGRNPDIVALAGRIGRTAGALAMKACNFAGLDPAFRRTNRRGLSGASEADRALWGEFEANSEQLAAEAEEAFARLEPAESQRDTADIRLPSGETDVLRVVRARRVQSFFRAAVVTSYNERCALSGLALPELLTASHIIPWSESVERRADPTDGVCLNALLDRAFDRGLFTLGDDLRVVVCRRWQAIAPEVAARLDLATFDRRPLDVPVRFACGPPARPQDNVRRSCQKQVKGHLRTGSPRTTSLLSS